MAFVPQGHGIAGNKGQEGVVADVAEKVLREPGGNAEDIVDGSHQAGVVSGIDSARSRSLQGGSIETRWRSGLGAKSQGLSHVSAYTLPTPVLLSLSTLS